MKKIILLLALLLVGISSQAQTKTGTIDAEYILSLMPEISQVETNLQEYNKQLQEELQQTIKKYEDLVTEYQANAATYSEEEKAKKESEIIALENEIKNFRQKASVLIQMRRNELTQPLYQKIDEAMQTVIREQNYTHIFNLSGAGGNNIAFADPNFDITAAVMAKLNIKDQQ